MDEHTRDLLEVAGGGLGNLDLENAALEVGRRTLANPGSGRIAL